MPKKRSPERDKAREIYKQHNGQITLREIANQLGIPEKSVSGWKAKDKWDDTEYSKRERSTPIRTPKEKPPKPSKQELKALEDLENSELTEKQKLFCLYYIKNFNATQAAIKAGYAPGYAMEQGWQLLQKTKVKAEIQRLKGIKRQSILISEDDIVERYMRIAFADMTDFVEWGRVHVPVMGAFGPVEKENPNTGEKETLMVEVNDVRFKESSIIDGGLVCEVKNGKNGASIKLEDRQKALDWLAKWFDMNPDSRHRKEYDKRKLEIELMKAEAALNKSSDVPEESAADDGFLEALGATVGNVWEDGKPENES